MAKNKIERIDQEISYTNLNSKYWQEHFYSYGRLP